MGKESVFDARDAGSIRGREDPLEEEMATHSSILAWETPWTEEPGGLQSMGSQRVRHKRVTKHTEAPRSKDEHLPKENSTAIKTMQSIIRAL